jgi:DNA-binding transcriptional MerR regulator
VAAMFQVNASLLRYWESEFDLLKPRKNKKGDRFFRPDDIKHLKMIHHLLREKKYTIEGARAYLKKSGKRKLPIPSCSLLMQAAPWGCGSEWLLSRERYSPS